MEKDLLEMLEKIINSASRPINYSGSDRTFVKIPSGLVEQAKELVNRAKE